MSEDHRSETSEDSKAPLTKTKIFINNLDGFAQKYLVKALVENEHFEISGSRRGNKEKEGNKIAGVLSSVNQVVYFMLFYFILLFNLI